MSEVITRQEFDRMLSDADVNLNAGARMVLMAYAQHMNYKPEPVTAYKAEADIAVFAGLNKDTAGKYRDALVADGFLVDSGDKAKVSKFGHELVRYYLGRGVPTHSFIMRKKAWNKGNVASHSDSVSTASGSDTSGKPLRQKRVAAPTQAVSGSDSVGVNNQLNNPSNNQTNNRTPLADAPGKVGRPSPIPEGNEVAAAGGKDSSSYQVEETRPSLIPERKGHAAYPPTEGSGDSDSVGVAKRIKVHAGNAWRLAEEYKVTRTAGNYLSKGRGTVWAVEQALKDKGVLV